MKPITVITTVKQTKASSQVKYHLKRKAVSIINHIAVKNTFQVLVVAENAVKKCACSNPIPMASAAVATRYPGGAAVNMTDVYRPFLIESHGRDEPDNGSKSKNLDSQEASRSTTSEVEAAEVEASDPTFRFRLKTFDNWPNPQISKTTLAKAGFVYTGQDDIVQCPLCKIEGYRWVSGDNPMEDHREWSPSCPFVRRVEHDHSEGSSRSLDTCGLYGVEILPNSVPEDNKIDFKKLGIHRINGALYEDKVSYESRLATFKNWPRSLKQRPADLAEAGFYYTGVGDHVMCFYCGGGLKDWVESDDPWEQHALWFDSCMFLILKKGAEFIESVKSNKDSNLSLPSLNGEIEAKEEEASAAEPSSEKCEELNGKESEVLEKTLCKICFKNEVAVVFLPCGHIVACVDCAAALKTCPVCRKPLEASLRAFLS